MKLRINYPHIKQSDFVDSKSFLMSTRSYSNNIVVFIWNMVRMLPIAIKITAVMSYLQTNFSFRNFIDRNMLKSMAMAQVVVNRVTSANGRRKPCAALAMSTGINPSNMY